MTSNDFQKWIVKEANVVVYDNGGSSVDRYTVVIDKEAFGMSDNASSPNGFNQYIGSVGADVKISQLGKKLDKIPSSIKKAVEERKTQCEGNEFEQWIEQNEQKGKIVDATVTVANPITFKISLDPNKPVHINRNKIFEEMERLVKLGRGDSPIVTDCDEIVV